MDLTVKDIVTTPPASPREGDSYILNASNVDSVHKLEPVITFEKGRWNITSPSVGDHVRVVNETTDKSYQYYNTGWEAMGGPLSIGVS